MKKRLLSILLTVCMVATLFSAMGMNAYADGETIEYTLKAGDSVYKVCQKLGIDFYANYDWITATNKISNYSSLPVGKKLILPVGNVSDIVGGNTGSNNSANSSTPATPGTHNVKLLTGDSVVSYLIPYTVSSGDTLYDICLARGLDYNKTVDSIMKLNGLKNANRIAVGRTLLLPSSTAPASGSCVAIVSHAIVSGDATYNLCKSYGIDYEDNLELLKALNGKDNMASIKYGQKLLIPVPTTVTAGSNSGNAGNTGSSGNSGNTGNSGNSGNSSNTGNTGNSSNSGNTGSTTAKVYNINKTTTNVNQGSYTVLVNNSESSTAASGATVTVNATARKGYKLDYVTVTDKNGNAVSVNGTTFTMPESDVTVKAVFVSSQEYKITSGYTMNGTYVVTVNGVETDYAAEGQTVKIVPTAAYGYELESVSYYRSTNKANVHEVSDKTFTMPAYDVTINVSFRGAQDHAIEHAGVANGNFSTTINGVKASYAKAGEVVTVNTTPADGFELKKITVTGDNGIDVPVNNGSFVMPEYGVTVKVKFVGIEFNVISAAASNGSFTVSADKAEAGTWIQVVPKADNGWAVDKVYYTNAEGNQVQVTSSNYSFPMPARDTTITVTFRKGNYSLSGNVAEFQKGGSKVTCANPGDTVTIKFQDKPGYKVSKVTGTYGDGANATTFEIKDGKFTMPIGAVNVNVTYEKLDLRLTKKDSTGGDFYFTLNGNTKKVDYAQVGDWVYVTALPSKDYHCTQVIVTDANGNTIPFDYTNNYFVMPQYKVSVKVTFAK